MLIVFRIGLVMPLLLLRYEIKVPLVHFRWDDTSRGVFCAVTSLAFFERSPPPAGVLRRRHACVWVTKHQRTASLHAPNKLALACVFFKFSKAPQSLRFSKPARSRLLSTLLLNFNPRAEPETIGQSKKLYR